MDGWEIARKDRSLGKVIGASLRERAPQGSARCARRPSTPLTCALAAAHWQLWRAAMPLAGVQTNAERKKNFRNYLPLTSCLHGRVKENHGLNSRLTRGVSRVRLNASATFLIASAWVGYG
jgi:hypothetical protein